MPSNNSSAQQCLNLISDIDEIINRGMSAFGNVTVKRELLASKLQQLRASLPKTIEQAAEFVRRYEEVMANAEKECETKLNEANLNASKMEEEAKQKSEAMLQEAESKAKEITDEAEAKAADMMAQARQECSRILDEADNQAKYLVSQEEVLRRAKVEANELRTAAQNELAGFRSNAYSEADQLLADLDRTVTGIQMEIRQHRSDLNAQR